MRHGESHLNLRVDRGREGLTVTHTHTHQPSLSHAWRNFPRAPTKVCPDALWEAALHYAGLMRLCPLPGQLGSDSNLLLTEKANDGCTGPRLSVRLAVYLRLWPWHGPFYAKHMERLEGRNDLVRREVWVPVIALLLLCWAQAQKTILSYSGTILFWNKPVYFPFSAYSGSP